MTDIHNVEDVERRLEQIEKTAHRVRPITVGNWHSATGLVPSPADSVLIAPTDLAWLITLIRLTHSPHVGDITITVRTVDALLTQIEQDRNTPYWSQPPHSESLDGAEAWLLSLRDFLE